MMKEEDPQVQEVLQVPRMGNNSNYMLFILWWYCSMPMRKITTNWKILQETGIPDHLTCLLRNLYAGQEATVRTGYRTTDCFEIQKRSTSVQFSC